MSDMTFSKALRRITHRPQQQELHALPPHSGAAHAFSNGLCQLLQERLHALLGIKANAPSCLRANTLPHGRFPSPRIVSCRKLTEQRTVLLPD